MEESTEPKALSRFEKHDEFTHLQQSLLTADLNIESSVDETRNETNLLQRLLNIVSIYLFHSPPVSLSTVTAEMLGE